MSSFEGSYKFLSLSLSLIKNSCFSSFLKLISTAVLDASSLIMRFLKIGLFNNSFSASIKLTPVDSIVRTSLIKSVRL